jgi:RNA polymerase sigma-70 factor (ECF subfamily)
MSEELKMLFSRVLEDNKQKILRICRVYAANLEDQRDVYQEVALNIWKSLPSFRQDSNIDTWVYRICLNVCMQYAFKLRKERRNRVDIEGITISDEVADKDGDQENREKTKLLFKCLAMLNETEKSLILLYLDELSHKDIANILGLSENHVAVKLARIKKKLIHCINTNPWTKIA